MTSQNTSVSTGTQNNSTGGNGQVQGTNTNKIDRDDPLAKLAVSRYLMTHATNSRVSTNNLKEKQRTANS
jgi:hypothetical protein